MKGFIIVNETGGNDINIWSQHYIAVNQIVRIVNEKTEIAIGRANGDVDYDCKETGETTIYMTDGKAIRTDRTIEDIEEEINEASK